MNPSVLCFPWEGGKSWDWALPLTIPAEQCILLEPRGSTDWMTSGRSWNGDKEGGTCVQWLVQLPQIRTVYIGRFACGQCAPDWTNKEGGVVGCDHPVFRFRALCVNLFCWCLVTSAKSTDLRLSVEGHVPYEVKGDSCSQSRTQKYNTERLFFQIKKKLEYSLNVQIETDNAGQMTSCKRTQF